MALGTRLLENGVNAVLDKWELKPGHDAPTFMERMATADCTHVVMICTPAYVAKANGRHGGVGTEAQIISKKVYNSVTQTKFVAVIAERDAHGQVCVPIYAEGRIHIDLSQERFEDGLQELLRWAHDEPLHEKPPIGPRPDFTARATQIPHQATAQLQVALKALRAGQPNASGAFTEFLASLPAAAASLANSTHHEHMDDALIELLDESRALRDGCIEATSTAIRYLPSPLPTMSLQACFDGLLTLDEYNPRDYGGLSAKAEALGFITHELFLCAVALLLKTERFQEVGDLFDRDYPSKLSGHEGWSRYSEIRPHLRLLKHRKHRLKIPRISLHADILKSRCEHGGISFQHLMQADFVAYMRTFSPRAQVSERWYPESLVYTTGRSQGAFEVFARCASKAYFDRFKGAIGFNGVSELQQAIDRLIDPARTDRAWIPKWDFDSLDIARLANREGLGTRF